MINPMTYVSQVIQEVQKVSWPTREQTQQKTLLVICISLIISVYVGLIDVVFQRIISSIL